MDYNAIPQKEQIRRQVLVQQVKAMLAEHLTIEAEDETTMMIAHKIFHLELLFSESHPLMVVCLTKALPEDSGALSLKELNALNLHSILGTHTLNDEIGCYAYRAAVWLDALLTFERFAEILERCEAEANRGLRHMLSANREE